MDKETIDRLAKKGVTIPITPDGPINEIRRVEVEDQDIESAERPDEPGPVTGLPSSLGRLATRSKPKGPRTQLH